MTGDGWGNGCTQGTINGRPAATVVREPNGTQHHFVCTLDQSYKIACGFDNTGVFNQRLWMAKCDNDNVYAAEPAVAADADGLGVTVYAIRADGTIVSEHIEWPFAWWRTLNLQPTGLVQADLKSPAADTWDSGSGNKPNLVGRVGNTFWYSQGTGIPGFWVSGPAVVGGSFNGQLNVFGEGNDGALWVTHFVPGRGWVSPVWLGGVLNGSPSAVSWGPGIVHVFVLGADLNVYYVWSADDGVNFNGWYSIPS
jgi:hypothetical protein